MTFILKNSLFYYSHYVSALNNFTDRYPPMTENEWYFYYKKDLFFTTKNNKRLNRKAKNGTWHVNATKKSILNQQKVEIGFKRTLDFMEPDKKLTLWKMTEYHLLESNDTQRCT
ncbi:hypothetical protein F8388_003976 [Cannabis sativa]|uniref:NAC domain-containing protein n=1 Tax=Cannabis sativa TaxID=3483 RepID=A0A7J6GRH9_CANSA|nr:hypothetical protein F8388_003976 [Cannabis sativa]